VRAWRTFGSFLLPAVAASVGAIAGAGCDFDGNVVGDVDNASLDAALLDAPPDHSLPDGSSPDASATDASSSDTGPADATFSSEATSTNPATDATLPPDGAEATDTGAEAEITPEEDTGADTATADSATADSGTSDTAASDTATADSATTDVQPDAATASPDAAPSGPVPACSDSPDSGPTATSDPGEGCADETREGLEDIAAYPDVAACAGPWTGTVDQAQDLCSAGWHVCLGSEPALTSVAFADGISFCGCFAFDAAQDNYTCHPGCEAAVNAGVDTAANIDMAGLGATCGYQFSGAGSCITGGRIDASENSGTGCNFTDGLSGVVCCRNTTADASDQDGE
jgi:hypothetical protein